MGVGRESGSEAEKVETTTAGGRVWLVGSMVGIVSFSFTLSSRVPEDIEDPTFLWETSV